MNTETYSKEEVPYWLDRQLDGTLETVDDEEQWEALGMAIDLLSMQHGHLRAALEDLHAMNTTSTYKPNGPGLNFSLSRAWSWNG